MTVEEVTENLSNLQIEELNPLSPEVIQRQATINIGKNLLLNEQRSYVSFF